MNLTLCAPVTIGFTIMNVDEEICAPPLQWQLNHGFGSRFGKWMSPQKFETSCGELSGIALLHRQTCTKRKLLDRPCVRFVMINRKRLDTSFSFVLGWNLSGSDAPSTCIWKDRCKAVLEHVPPSPARTIHGASIAINEFLGSLEHGRHQTEPPTLSNDNQQHLWIPHASPFVKEHSWRLYQRHFHPSVANSAIEAEAQACLEGCKLAAEMGYRQVTFESDCKEIISPLKGPLSNGRWEIYPILSNVRDVLNCFQTYGWTWIPRTTNQAADHLAMLANSRMSPEVWVNRPPSSLMHILNKDGLPCPPRSA
ncbi:unnamed protein product [Prunus brigantina]